MQHLASTSRLAAVATAIALASAALAAQAPAKASTPATAKARNWSPSRTPWGDPDLQGAYTNKDENGIPMERPSQFQGKTIDQVQQSELADIVRQRQQDATERAPGIGGAETGAGPVHWYEYYGAKNSRPWLDRRSGGREDSVADARRATARGGAQVGAARARRIRFSRRSQPVRSLHHARRARLDDAGDLRQLVPDRAGAGFVAIRYEMIHETRVIPLDGRPHVGRDIRLYMGDPRGHWEGNTLVVETTNFNGRMSADIVGYGSPDRGASAQLRIVERFTPSGPTTVEWSVTLDDPHTWTRPWTFAMNLTKDDTQPVFEYGCHEGNYGLSNILSAARAEESR